MTGPVEVDGTIFSVDDTDAAQGDGEGYEVTTGMGPDLLTGPCAAVSEMVEMPSLSYGCSPIDVCMLCGVCAEVLDVTDSGREKAARMDGFGNCRH